jgi:hypothetical protein
LRFLFVFLALIAVTGLNAATVTGLVWNVMAQPYATNLYFIPVSTPTTNGNAVLGSPMQTKSTTNGVFTIQLLPSNYFVLIGTPKDTLKIVVPTNSDSSTFNITTLITNKF